MTSFQTGRCEIIETPAGAYVNESVRPRSNNAPRSRSRAGHGRMLMETAQRRRYAIFFCRTERARMNCASHPRK